MNVFTTFHPEIAISHRANLDFKQIISEVWVSIMHFLWVIILLFWNPYFNCAYRSYTIEIERHNSHRCLS